MKIALPLHMEHFNWYGGLKVPGCWTTGTEGKGGNSLKIVGLRGGSIFTMTGTHLIRAQNNGYQSMFGIICTILLYTSWMTGIKVSSPHL